MYCGLTTAPAVILGVWYMVLDDCDLLGVDEFTVSLELLLTKNLLSLLTLVDFFLTEDIMYVHNISRKSKKKRNEISMISSNVFYILMVPINVIVLVSITISILKKKKNRMKLRCKVLS
jgi:hypothetical protein